MTKSLLEVNATERAEEVARRWSANRQTNSWAEALEVLDLIEADLQAQGIVEAGLVHRHQLLRFRATAFMKGVGTANCPAPKRPMTLDEGLAFITRLIAAWRTHRHRNKPARNVAAFSMDSTR